MKNILFLLTLFLSFPAAAQFPALGQNGYKESFVTHKDVPPFIIENDRNTFTVYRLAPVLWDDANPEASLDSIFKGNHPAYNQRFYYASYQYKNNYIYTVFIHSRMLVLGVYSMFNDAELEKCKRMLDKQADIYIRTEKPR